MDRILVGLDGSKRAEPLLRAAQELARRIGGKLILFRGVGIPVEIPKEAYSMSPDELQNLLTSRARTYLEDLAKMLPEALLMGIAVGIGTPWESICHAADEHQADVIVIGSHGYSGIDRLLGTTAAKVVNHAKQSVLVVRHPEKV